ncbi:MAG TPA: DNA repair protein RadA [Chloroflexi bacterium]|nr:DNA repair protein RadA [Chloroflexota bacterium]
MAKTRTAYVCQTCGSSRPKWMGRCPDCGEWNTMVETLIEAPSRSTAQPGAAAPMARSAPIALPDIAVNGNERLPVAMEELSRVLGGGIVPGSVVLVGGDPGIGKSTLLLQLAAMMSTGSTPVLYVSGEESVQQVKMRAARLGIRSSQLYILAENSLEQILLHLEEMRPGLAVVDSIQSIHMEERASSAGSVSQVRECANALMRTAKEQAVPVFIVGHVTKTGAIAGPRVLEHIVDTVLYLEGERFHTYRLLRSVKNRFGSTNEVGVFEMRDDGMAEVSNPSQVFLDERLGHATGSAVAVTMEGTRPILVEIQALVSPAASPERPRRTANGIDVNRLVLLSAVLARRVGLRLADQDIFVNVVGGLRVHEPAVDLAVAVAVASSLHNRPVHGDMALFGEIGLAGELRTVSQTDRRLREAAKLGFTRGLVPSSRQATTLAVPGLTITASRSLAEAISLALE